MSRQKKRKPVLVIGIRVTESELEQVKLIMAKRRINSYSHTLRVLIEEEAEKILKSASSVSETNKCSTSA